MIYWPMRDKITGDFESLHNEKLRDLYCYKMLVERSSQRR